MFLLAGLGLSVGVWATPPVAFYVNQILAMGATDAINQQVQFDHDPKRNDDEPWHAQLHAHGVTDFYVQRLGLLPGGYSGWHTHPGVLIGTVVSGSIEFFHADCRNVTYTAGQVSRKTTRLSP